MISIFEKIKDEEVVESSFSEILEEGIDIIKDALFHHTDSELQIQRFISRLRNHPEYKRGMDEHLQSIVNVYLQAVSESPGISRVWF